ncbi:MAG: DUF2851 family protein [Thermomicrobium sp.]|nr:DUF2851 family protein [Thermomicrobium sp.]
MVPTEHWLAFVWQEQRIARELETAQGAPLRVIYRGVWTHRHGPDFADASLDLAGTLLSGDVELHVRSSDWYAHRHHEDPAYDRVVLHVVWHDDLGQPVSRRDGRPIPTVELARFVDRSLDPTVLPLGRPLGALGFAHCAPELAASEPHTLHALFEDAGDHRLRHKVAQVQSLLGAAPPGQVLYWLFADALGYHRNREGMRMVAEHLPSEYLEATVLLAEPTDRFPLAAALLLGVAGFLPVLPQERNLAPLDRGSWHRIEALWSDIGRGFPTPRIRWRTAGARPANHPLRRLLSLATLVAASPQGLLTTLVQRVTADRPRSALTEWLRSPPLPLGRDRTHDVLVNVVVPFALAYGESIGEETLVEAASHLWRTLPAGRGNAITRATLEQVCGPTGLALRSARAEQGLLHLYRTGCQPRRCYECPVAHLVLARPSVPELTGHRPTAPHASSPPGDGDDPHRSR